MASTCLKNVPVMLLFLYTVAAQQAYEEQFAQDCTNTEHTDIVYGYECNGQQNPCQAYAVYRSRDNYPSLARISQLLNSNLSQMAAINGFSDNEILASNQPVYAPLNCSCVGNYSQANATYTVKDGDNYQVVANRTYQTLSTCQALQQQNNVSDLKTGMNLTVPLRCACPTAAQAGNGTRYLLSYPVISGDTVNTIGERYDATAQDIFDANEMVTGDTIYGESNLLVPLRTEPKRAPATAPPPPPPPPAATPTGGGSGSKAGLYAGIAVAAAAALAVVVAAGCVLYRKAKKKTPPTPPGKGKDSGGGSIPGSP